MSTHPDKPLLGEQFKATIVTPDGKAANYPSTSLSGEEAKLLREYKKFLNRWGYKEALYCSRCWEMNLQHGCEAYVTNTDIGIMCRCRYTFFKGATY